MFISVAMNSDEASRQGDFILRRSGRDRAGFAELQIFGITMDFADDRPNRLATVTIGVGLRANATVIGP